jgi:ribosomal protein L11 methyltransferase
VVALDNDSASVEATVANARVNEVEIEVRRFDLRTEDVPRAGTIAANLLGPLLRALAPRLGAAGALPGRLIASGLLAHEADGIADAFGVVGLRETTRRESGEWAALLLER